MRERQKHKKTSHSREQEVSNAPGAVHNTAKNRQDSIYTYDRQTQNTINKTVNKRSTTLEQQVRNILEGLRGYIFQKLLLA